MRVMLHADKQIDTMILFQADLLIVRQRLSSNLQHATYL